MARPRKRSKVVHPPANTTRIEEPEALSTQYGWELRQLYYQLTDHARFDEIAAVLCPYFALIDNSVGKGADS